MELELALPKTTFTGLARMRYETPPGGITLTGYIVRRLHKTTLLEQIEQQWLEQPPLALVQFGIYALASATSWGPALYQPYFDAPGTSESEPDPDTGAQVTVQHLTNTPHYTFTYEIRLPDGGEITGQEAVTGTTVGLRGLGMPAPSRYDYQSAAGDYKASAVGTIHSELAPRLFAAWQIRGYGRLQLSDSLGQKGTAQLDRDGNIQIHLVTADERQVRASFQLS